MDWISLKWHKSHGINCCYKQEHAYAILAVTEAVKCVLCVNECMGHLHGAQSSPCTAATAGPRSGHLSPGALVSTLEWYAVPHRHRGNHLQGGASTRIAQHATTHMSDIHMHYCECVILTHAAAGRDLSVHTYIHCILYVWLAIYIMKYRVYTYYVCTYTV